MAAQAFRKSARRYARAAIESIAFQSADWLDVCSSPTRESLPIEQDGLSCYEMPAIVPE
jgi:hypothetical protein